MREGKPGLLLVLDVLSGALLLAAAVMVLFYTPVEAVMGPVQKVFYFHVAAGWTGMLGFFSAFIAAVVYLIKRSRTWDLAGQAGVEIGMVFMMICIITGMVWARPVWNTWWTWDPRLTTAAVMEMAYAAYLMLRQGIEEPERRMRFGAVYAVIAFISVPLTFLSIRIFRTIHPVVIGSGDPGSVGVFSMTGPMQLAFFFSLFVFSVLFVNLFWHRIRLGALAERVEQLKIRLEQ